MAVEICWQSRQGKRTENNQDFCGVGLRPEAVLCVVLDGSTTGLKSGELVRAISSDLTDWFVQAKGRIVSDDVANQLREIQKMRSRELPQASASYLVTLIDHEKTITVLHAGDCLIGTYKDKAPIEWLIKPHTLANAIAEVPIDKIASSPLRNKLTRSFRASEFVAPAIETIADETVVSLVIATDGFWAELRSDDQSRFLDDKDPRPIDYIDDCSALTIHILGSISSVDVRTATDENLYVAALS